MKTNAKQLAAARRAMEVIAAREGISVEEVRRGISLAILWHSQGTPVSSPRFRAPVRSRRRRN